MKHSMCVLLLAMAVFSAFMNNQIATSVYIDVQ